MNTYKVYQQQPPTLAKGRDPTTGRPRDEWVVSLVLLGTVLATDGKAAIAAARAKFLAFKVGAVRRSLEGFPVVELTYEVAH